MSGSYNVIPSTKSIISAALTLSALVTLSLVGCGDKSMKLPKSDTTAGKAGDSGGSGLSYRSFSNLPQNKPMIEIIQDKIFTPRCTACHSAGGAATAGKLNLSNTATSFRQLVGKNSDSNPKIKRVAESRPLADDSFLVAKLVTDDLRIRMPLGGKLNDDDIKLIQLWIDSGAKEKMTIPDALKIVQPNGPAKKGDKKDDKASDSTSPPLDEPINSSGDGVDGNATAPPPATGSVALVTKAYKEDVNRPVLNVIVDKIFNKPDRRGQGLCTSCHVPGNPFMFGLALDTNEGAFKSLVAEPKNLAVKLVTPKDISEKKNYLLAKLVEDRGSRGNTLRMPMNKTPLSKTEIDLIRYWIWSGAKADTKLSEALKLGDLPKKTDDL